MPPAGTSPAVFFLPVEFQTTGRPIAMLADPVDPATGELLSIERGFDPTDAAVITALRTIRGSGSAVENVGNRYRDATHVTPELTSFMREETRLALEHLTSTNQIRLDAVTVLTEGDTANLVVEYVNLARQQDRKVHLLLGALLGSAAA